MKQAKATVKKRHGLILTICAAIILITLAVSIAVSMINYQEYRSAVVDVHTEFATGACKSVEAVLTP